MKAFSLLKLIAVFLIIFSNGIQAQTTDTKLNQVELMKQFIGSWKYEGSDGTSMIFENIPFGNAMTGNTKTITKDASFDSHKYLWGYDKKADKIILAEIFSHTPNMEIDILWFTSKTTVEGVLQKDIANPETAVTKFRFDFKSPDAFVLKVLQNNNVAAELTWNREKK
jgi:hypothetical protein